MIRALPVLFICAGTAACTNTTQSVDHSAVAASYGSAAAGESVATVVAVPLIVSGGALSVTGSAIQEIGDGSLQAGSQVLSHQTARPITIAPNGAPTLD